MYLNDLTSVTERCFVSLFADDTEMDNAKNPEEFNELQKSIDDDFSCLKTYFDDNRLCVTVDKCEFMLLGTYQTLQNITNPQIHINNEHLRQVSVAKYLGIYINENLCWDHHIDTLVKKISSKISILRSLRNILPIYTLKLIYNAIVLPHFNYADVVYDAASETNKSRLQRLQTRAAQLISGTGPRNPVFKELGWLSLENRRCMYKCTIVLKCRNGLAPSYLIDSFNATATAQEILLNSEYP